LPPRAPGYTRARWSRWNSAVLSPVALQRIARGEPRTLPCSRTEGPGHAYPAHEDRPVSLSAPRRPLDRCAIAAHT
jgi:hypothetical protein